MFAQLKDLQFKSLAGKRDFSLYGSDVEMLHSDLYFVIEYENSSRGLCANLLRILRLQDIHKQKIRIILIRTDKHVKMHGTDFLNCSKLIELVPQSDQLKIVIIDGCDFKGFDPAYLAGLF
jgi:hypothetical protein